MIKVNAHEHSSLSAKEFLHTLIIPPLGRGHKVTVFLNRFEAINSEWVREVFGDLIRETDWTTSSLRDVLTIEGLCNGPFVHSDGFPDNQPDRDYFQVAWEAMMHAEKKKSEAAPQPVAAEEAQPKVSV